MSLDPDPMPQVPGMGSNKTLPAQDRTVLHHRCGLLLRCITRSAEWPQYGKQDGALSLCCSYKAVHDGMS